MILKSYLFKQVTIVGIGLIGGSIGLALKKKELVKEVVGLSSRQTSLDEAKKIGAIDTATMNLQEAVRNADLIILATPVESIMRFLENVNPHVRRHTIITDVGSAKADIVDKAQKLLTTPQMFVGGHPLAGSEKCGVINARDDLFESALCILTPAANTNRMAKEKVRQMWLRLGARVKDMPAEEHDEILAYISHLPHVMAFSLMESIPSNYLEMAPQGLKDTTRISASSPQMWSDICLANAKYTVKAIDGLVKNLALLRKAIIKRDHQELIHFFTKANEKRNLLEGHKPS